MASRSPSLSPQWWRTSLYAHVRAVSNRWQLRPNPTTLRRFVRFHEAGGMSPDSSSASRSSSSPYR